jgi:hypothetical protein
MLMVLFVLFTTNTLATQGVFTNRHRLFLSNQSFCFRDIHRLMTILQSLSFILVASLLKIQQNKCMNAQFEHRPKWQYFSSGIIGK